MAVSFAQVKVGVSFSRNDLARLWGYAGIQALARGVVTPRDDNKIILFVTHEKQADHTQYADALAGGTLHWEGPTDHFAEERIVATASSGDEIHLFYRNRHHSDFVYYGQLRVVSSERHTDRPSRFTFQIM